MKTKEEKFNSTTNTLRATPDFIQPLKVEYYLLDWDKVKSFEDLKKVFGLVVRLEIADNSIGFDDIKQFLKEKL